MTSLCLEPPYKKLLMFGYVDKVIGEEALKTLERHL